MVKGMATSPESLWLSKKTLCKTMGDKRSAKMKEQKGTVIEDITERIRRMENQEMP